MSDPLESYFDTRQQVCLFGAFALSNARDRFGTAEKRGRPSNEPRRPVLPSPSPPAAQSASTDVSDIHC